MTPIKRGTARRLGLVLPQHYLTMGVVPDLSELALAVGRSAARARMLPPIDWGGISIAAHRRQLDQERRHG